MKVHCSVEMCMRAVHALIFAHAQLGGTRGRRPAIVKARDCRGLNWFIRRMATKQSKDVEMKETDDVKTDQAADELTADTTRGQKDKDLLTFEGKSPFFRTKDGACIWEYTCAQNTKMTL